MNGFARWVVAIVIVAGLVALIAFARGEPAHAEPTAPPTGAAILVA